MFLSRLIQKRSRLAFIGILSTATYLLLPAAGLAPAKAEESTVYSFKGGVDGWAPSSRVIVDAKGALYGATGGGGTFNWGTVFKLTRPASGTGQWTKTVLHHFGGPGDGASPQGDLIFDAKGALYGTTNGGGPSNLGTVFKLTPPSSGTGPWKETVLHSFTDPNSGAYPTIGLIFDTHGALYGTARSTVFKLTPPSFGTGPWTKTVLFTGVGPDLGLVFDSYGALYGTTNMDPTTCNTNNIIGQTSDCGTVFRLTPPASGKGTWTKAVLYTFIGYDYPEGVGPQGVIFDAKGSLYGTTRGAPPSNIGSVYKLTPPVSAASPWSLQILYRGSLLKSINGPLIFDAKGALYGTTAGNGDGVVFKLAPSSFRTAWTATELYKFPCKGGSGCAPLVGLTSDANGVLYGTTAAGGSAGSGEVFKLQCNRWSGTGKDRTCLSW